MAADIVLHNPSNMGINFFLLINEKNMFLKTILINHLFTIRTIIFRPSEVHSILLELLEHLQGPFFKDAV